MENHKRKFDLVIFDLGGTLIHFNGNWPEAIAESHQALVQNLIGFGYALDTQQFAADFLNRLNAYYRERETEYIELSTETILRALLAEHGYQNAPSRHLRPALDAMYAVTEKIWTLEDDTHAALQALREQGYQLGLISNANDDRDVEILVDINQLRQYFDLVLISAAVGLRKPHPQLFDIALDHYGVNPARAVMVGDTLNADILGAHHAGMKGIWITRRAADPRPGELEEIRPDAVINTLAELPELLASWPVPEIKQQD